MAKLVKKHLYSGLGYLIRKARKEHKFTQAELAVKAGLSTPAIHAVEHNRGRIQTWLRLLDVLGLELRGKNLPQSSSLGESIRLLRNRRGLGLRVVSQSTGISKPTLISLEIDASGNLKALDQVLRVLGAGPILIKKGNPISFYSHASTSSAHHSWETPPWLLDKLYAVFGRFDLDPCSPTKNSRRAPVKARVRFIKSDDALSLDWFGKVFMNPPYGRELQHWTDKARTEFLSGNAKLIVGLVPARTDTKWWHRDIVSEATVFFLKGRLSFGNSGQSAPFPSALVLWGGGEKDIEGIQCQFSDAQMVAKTSEIRKNTLV